MAAQNIALLALNAGEISRLALARVDLTKLRMATERQINFIPHVLGPCQFRPGTRYIANLATHGNTGWLGEFFFDEDEKVLLVLQAADLRFLINDVYLTRVAVTAAVSNGTFTGSLASWTDSDEAGAVSDWVAPGYLRLLGTGTNFAYRDQQVVVTETGTEHALRVTVERNTVVLRVGTAIGLGDYLDVSLLPGTYSLAFTPTGNFWIRLGAVSDYHALVDSITVEAAGAVSLPAPWTITTEFDSIRYDQSGDVLFVASDGHQQRRIERRAENSRSWGLALYQADDGPFRLSNLGSTTIAPSATSGAINLTASRALFQAGHLGALFRLTHSAQAQTATLGALTDDTGEIRVTGLTSQNFRPSNRIFGITIDGTFTATISLQRSIGAPGSWQDVKSWTAPTSESYDDGLDNQIIYYKLECTAYTSGSALVGLFYNASSQTGIARITGITSSVIATADVLSQFGSTEATNDWSEGEWSSYRGWPTAVALDGGRLVWGTGIKAQHSVSDAFASFDDIVEGDSGPINKTIVTGGLSGARWMLSLQRLLVGTSSAVTSVRASAFDEPLTPTAYVARECSDDGADNLRPLKLGQLGIYAGFKRLFKLMFDLNQGDYGSQAIDRLKPEMFTVGIRDIAVQRKPDNALIWVVLTDGSAVCVALNPKEEVEAMMPIGTDGTFERVAVLRGSDEDDVYFIVNRNVGGTKRYIEKLAKRGECMGGLLNKTMDSHIVYQGAPTTTITGLTHLEGKSVVVWGDSQPRIFTTAPKTVTGGQITGVPSISNAIVGLAYTGELKTVKLAYAAEHGTALGMRKRVSRLGLMMADVTWKGIRFGRDFANLTGLPETYRGRVLADGEVLVEYDADPGSFGGLWDTDSRVCIQVQSPYCVTLKALVMPLETNEMGQESKK